MERIVFFTATYNRAKFLQRAYEALCRQSCKEFCWMIIDDGSTDNTKDVVNSLKMKSDFKIIYIYKENGGLYTCYNTAIKYVDENSELMCSIDSDDWIAEDAVEKILGVWDRCQNTEKYAGVIGLDYLPDHTLIGTTFPAEDINLIDNIFTKRVVGDKSAAIRIDLMKKYGPMPVYSGEKDFNPIYLLVEISKDYDFLTANECFKYVEYQEEGMSANLFLQYKRSPNSFAEMRRQYLNMDGIPFVFAIRQAIHYVSSCIFAGKWIDIWGRTKRPMLCALCLLPGILLNLYVRYRVTINKKNKILGESQNKNL